MSDPDSLTPQNSADLDNDITNKLFITDSILPFNKGDLVDTKTSLDDGSSQFEVRQYHYNPTRLEQLKVEGLYMAVKRIQLPRKRRRNYTNPYKDKLIKEAKILTQLKYSNDIVEFYGLCFDQDYALLCMELMDMNLSEVNKIFLKIQGSCPFDMLPHIVVPIIDGLEYCHGKNIIHRDIKPTNILFNRSGKIKVGDFSESRELDAIKTGDFNGTIPYWSPERVRSTEVKDPKYDIWGLGLTLLEIICGFHPYEKLLGQKNPNMFTLMQFIENIDPETLLQCAHIQIDNFDYLINTNHRAELLKLISHCLKRVDERATIYDLKNTSYYKYAQEECRDDESLMKRHFELYEICFHTHADKWIVLKNYNKEYPIIEFMIRELAFLHKFAGQPFMPKFYGWGSIEHNNVPSYGLCLEVIDMNLKQFYSHFIKNFGSEAFKDALSEGILGYISWVVLNALLEIHKKGFALRNVNSNNILVNDRGEVKLCGFTWATTHEDKGTLIIYEYSSLYQCRKFSYGYNSLYRRKKNFRRDRNNYPSNPSDVWNYAASLIEFACGRQPRSFKKFYVRHPQSRIFPEEIELEEMSNKCFSIGYSHQPHEFFMECLKQYEEPNFDALTRMDFYQQASKNIDENKERLAKWVQAIIIRETREYVPAQWFHKFMDPENAQIYDISNHS